MSSYIDKIETGGNGSGGSFAFLESVTVKSGKYPSTEDYELKACGTFELQGSPLPKGMEVVLKTKSKFPGEYSPTLWVEYFDTPQITELEPGREYTITNSNTYREDRASINIEDRGSDSTFNIRRYSDSIVFAASSYN